MVSKVQELPRNDRLFDRRALVSAARHFPWTPLASIAICGGIVMLGGLWFRATVDSAAAYKAYHRAKIEFEIKRATISDVCGASRRCCIAQCAVPRPSASAVLEAHLARVESLHSAAEAADGRGVQEAWQIFRDEAALWVQYGKPK
jgi:hypothetical protein